MERRRPTDRRRTARRLVRPLAAALVAGSLALVPGLARAHDVTGSRFDAPLPLPLLFAGAGGTVALTALWLAVADRSPATDGPTTDTADGRARITVSSRTAHSLRLAAGGAFGLGVATALVVGSAGRQVAAENFATVFVWPVWFRGLGLAAVLLGSLWPALSPWRWLYRALCRLEADRIAVLGAYPERLGAWPALAGVLLLVGVVENLTVIPRSPALTAAVVALYGLATLAGAVLFGPAWFGRADPLGALYRLLGRVAPLSIGRADDGALAIGLRPPWRGCTTPVTGPAVVVLVVAAVYTVSFDGFTNTRLYQDVLFGTRELLGTGPPTSVLLYLTGLVVFLGTFAVTVAAGDALGWPEDAGRGAAADGGAADDPTASGGGADDGDVDHGATADDRGVAGRETDGDATAGAAANTTEGRPAGSTGPSLRDAARAFAPTILPIAAAYDVAHNYPYVLRSVVRLGEIALEPLGATVGAADPLGWLSLPAFWGSQVALVVAGHVVAAVAAHRVAAARYRSPSDARRGHFPLVALMVGYTVLSLWIVSQPVVA